MRSENLSDGPDGSGGPHVFVEDLAHPALRDEDRHHVRRVLRLQVGQPLTVSDGAGSWRPAILASDGDPEPTGEIHSVQPGSPEISVATALVKGDRPETIVRQLTEIGIDRILFFAADRSIVRWDGDRSARNLERLTRVAREASMQSRRVRLPEVGLLGGIQDAAGMPGAALCVRGAPPLTRSISTLLVGPEGGWTDDEVEIGLGSVGLPGMQLRTETAAVVAGAQLVAMHRTPAAFGEVGA